MNLKLTREKREQVIGALRAGADMSMAARAVGVTRRAIQKLAVRDEKFREAMQEARDFADELVVKSLFDQARKGHVVACIFWLKNRRPDEWRDRHDLNVSKGYDDGVFRTEFDDGEEVYSSSVSPTVPTGTDPGSVQ